MRDTKSEPTPPAGPSSSYHRRRRRRPGWLSILALTALPLAVAAQDVGETEDTGEPADEPMVVEESITVLGIRADEEVPVTKTNLDREQIETLSYGQDVPKLLQYTPAVTWYSDSGAGTNYSYLSLRGIGQTRINVTLDGAPLNDPAEHALYFNNFHDFSSLVDSVQIQRGVGTSSVGTPSYGGSVNFASRPARETNGGDLRLVLGSFDTGRASIGYESGIFANGFSVGGRFSYADTEGYRDNSGSEHRTFFLSAGWQGKRSSLRLVSFSGEEASQLAFLAVEPEILAQNRRFNPLDEEERDAFGQDFAQIKFSHALTDRTLFTASLYYNGADGYFRLWDDPVAQSELLEFGIDQAFVGSMVTATTDRQGWSATFGLHYNDFRGDHTLDIGENRIYRNTGFKRTANVFGKVEVELGRWLLYGDVQLRWAEFSYAGDFDLGSVQWSFVDPKIGLRRSLSPGLSLYGSLGRAQREPTRMDLLLGEDNATVPHDLEAVRPEKVLDFELGVDWKATDWSLEANLYAMEFTDEIALTGELSEIGLPLRTNVEQSFRRGLEVDLRWRIAPAWSLHHTANLSHNRIAEWTQFYDVYDAAGRLIDSRALTYRDVPPLLTPEVVLNLGGEWSGRSTSVALTGRYVDDAQLDNTGLAEFRTPSFTNVDLRLAWNLERWWAAASPRLTLYVNNILDDLDQYPSGYSYQFLVEGATGPSTLDGVSYYYPLASRNAVLTLEIGL